MPQGAGGGKLRAARRPAPRPWYRGSLMTHWQTVALAALAVAFGLLVLWQVRPAFGSRRGAPLRKALREAHRRVEAAKSDDDRASALAEAADACAAAIGRSSAAVSYYLRAMRLRPGSVALVERAEHSLARRPRALETLLWRKLGAEGFTPELREAQTAALAALERVYQDRPRFAARARALAHLREALEAGPRSPSA